MTSEVPDDDHETQDQPATGEEKISNPQKAKAKAAACICRACIKGPVERHHGQVRHGLVR